MNNKHYHEVRAIEIPKGPDDPENYYAALGVSVDARPSVIEQAYRKKCETYHPDKLLQGVDNEHLRALSTAKFHSVQLAHFVLSDQKRRRAYDTMGAPGVNMLELVPKDTEMNQLEQVLRWRQTKDEYEKIVHEIGARGMCRMNIDMVHYGQQEDENEAARGEVQSSLPLLSCLLSLKAIKTALNDKGAAFLNSAYLTVYESVGVQLTEDTSMSLAATACTNPQQSHGLSVQVHNNVSSSWKVRTLGEITDRIFYAGFKLTRFFSRGWAITVGIKQKWNPLQREIPSSGLCANLTNAISSLASTLFPRVSVVEEATSRAAKILYLIHHHRWWDLWPFSFTFCNLEKAISARNRLNLRLTLSPHESQITAGWRVDNKESTAFVATEGCLSSTSAATRLTYSKEFNEKKRMWQSSVEADPSTNQCSVAYSLHTSVSKLNKVGIGMSYGSNQTAIHFHFTRHTHGFTIPIVVATQWSWMWAIGPAAFAILGKILVVNPLLHFFNLRKIKQRREKLKEGIAEKRQQALYEQELLKSQTEAARMREQSIRVGGLLITNAKYGCLFSHVKTKREDIPPSFDVTIPVQAAVKHSRLELRLGTKATLDGFYDPDPSQTEPKYLVVSYLFRGKKHEVEITDEELLELPQSAHLVEDDEE
eukprot:TRINITY_DN21610_c0_g1_i1.p1 TRINITY_DN21610_c0_g1~~TRINITY_DN21610_c0_g1_i1.p1  ORF type:complete len:657 (-),score=20.18 TRINITY_DN21610_c0_g1_i1:75-2024(-)